MQVVKACTAFPLLSSLLTNLPDDVCHGLPDIEKIYPPRDKPDKARVRAQGTAEKLTSS